MSDHLKRPSDLEQMAREWLARIWGEDGGACVHRPNGGICRGCARRAATESLAALLQRVRDERDVEWSRTVQIVDCDYQRLATEERPCLCCEILRRMGRKP